MAIDHVKTRMGDRFSALLMSLMALRPVLVYPNPFRSGSLENLGQLLFTAFLHLPIVILLIQSVESDVNPNQSRNQSREKIYRIVSAQLLTGQ